MYWQVFQFHFQKYITYKSEFVAMILSQVLQTVLLIVFWNIAAKNSDVVINQKKIVTYYILVTSLSNFVMATGMTYGKYIADLIKTGDLNQLLLKPVKMLSFTYVSNLGIRGPLLIVAALLVLVGLVFQSDINIYSIILFVPYMAGAIALSYSFNLFLGITAFYITETSFMRYVFQITIRVFSGLFIPLYFYPERLLQILRYTPFPYLAFKPVDSLSQMAIEANNVEELVILLLWIVVLFLISNSCWKYSLRKYEAIGL